MGGAMTRGAPLEVLLVPCRSGGRWRARATGTAPDGSELVITRESWDRADLTSEVVIAWFAAAERVEVGGDHAT
jgi:hypothetical protein